MGKKFGVSFSWKRALGVSGAKNRLSRQIGIPLTRSGRQRKMGRAMGCCVLLFTTISLISLITVSIACNKKKEQPIDKYKENVIKVDRQYNAGKKEGKRELNDQLYIEVYVPNYSKEKGKEICDYYKDYYSYLADELDSKLTIYINLWDKKVPKEETSDDYEGVNLLDNGVTKIHKNYKGGINYNYQNKYYFEDIF